MRSPDFCSAFWWAVFQTLLSHPAVIYLCCFWPFLSVIIWLCLPTCPPSFPNFHASTSFSYFVLPKIALQFSYHPLCCSSQHWGLPPQATLGCRKVSIWSTGESFLADIYGAHSSLWSSEAAITGRVLLVPCILTGADSVTLGERHAETCISMYAL